MSDNLQKHNELSNHGIYVLHNICYGVTFIDITKWSIFLARFMKNLPISADF